MLMTVQMGGRRRTHSECVGRKCSRCRCLRIERLSNLPLRIASHHLGLFCLSSRQPRLWQWVSWKPACLIAALLDVKVMMLLPLRLGQWGSLKPACLIAALIHLNALGQRGSLEPADLIVALLRLEVMPLLPLVLLVLMLLLLLLLLQLSQGTYC